MSERRIHEQYKDEPNERGVQYRYAAALASKGWQTELEVKVPGGEIDILATKDGEMRLIELKVRTNLSDVASGLGQLLIYGAHYPTAALYFVTPVPIGQFYIDILQQYGVSWIKYPDPVYLQFLEQERVNEADRQAWIRREQEAKRLRRQQEQQARQERSRIRQLEKQQARDKKHHE